MWNPFRRLTEEQKLARQREKDALEDAVIEAEIARDPDGMLITRFVLEELSPDEEAAFEARLDNDPAFQRHAAPTLALWSMPLAHDAESDAAVARCGWAKFAERVGLPPEIPHA